jgi:hypothetical protein
LSSSFHQIIYQDSLPPLPLQYFYSPTIVALPSHCSPHGGHPSTLPFSPPHANATVILLEDLSGLQRAAAPITLIIAVDYFVHKFKNVEYHYWTTKPGKLWSADGNSKIFRVSKASSSSLQVGQHCCSSILNKIEIPDTSPASHQTKAKGSKKGS